MKSPVVASIVNNEESTPLLILKLKLSLSASDAIIFPTVVVFSEIEKLGLLVMVGSLLIVRVSLTSGSVSTPSRKPDSPVTAKSKAADSNSKVPGVYPAASAAASPLSLSSGLRSL